MNSKSARSVIGLLFIFHFSFAQEPIGAFESCFPSLEKERINCLYQPSSDKEWWLGTENGLYKVNRENFTLYKVGKQQVLHIAEDRIGRIWLGTYDGQIGCYETDEVQYYFEASQYLQKHRKDLLITDLAISTENKMWVATTGNNLLVFDLNKLRLDFVDTVRSITSVYIDVENNKWLGTKEGLIYIDKRKGTKTSFFPAKEIMHITGNSEAIYVVSVHNQKCFLQKSRIRDGQWSSIGLPKSMEKDKIQDLFVNQAGSLWLSSKVVARKHQGGSWKVQGIPENGKALCLLPISGTDSLLIGSVGNGLFLSSPSVDTITFKINEPIEIDHLLFQQDKALLQEGHQPGLAKLLQFLLENPQYKVKIIGHTSYGVNKEKLVRLSLERANAVANYLINNKVSRTRIQTTGLGDKNLKNKHHSYSDDNKRVEVVIIDSLKF